MKKKDCCDKNPFVGIAGALGGIYLVIVIMFLIFAKDQIVFVATSIVWAFVVLGIALGAFASKAKK